MKSFIKILVDGAKTAIIPWNQLGEAMSSDTIDALIANGKIVSLERVDLTQEGFDALEEFKGYE